MAITWDDNTQSDITVAASTWTISNWSLSFSSGQRILVGISLGSSSVTVSTVTDSLGLTYRRAAASSSPLPSVSADLWYSDNFGSARSTVSVSVTLSAAQSSFHAAVSYCRAL